MRRRAPPSIRSRIAPRQKAKRQLASNSSHPRTICPSQGMTSQENFGHRLPYIARIRTAPTDITAIEKTPTLWKQLRSRPPKHRRESRSTRSCIRGEGRERRGCHKQVRPGLCRRRHRSKLAPDQESRSPPRASSSRRLGVFQGHSARTRYLMNTPSAHPYRMPGGVWPHRLR